MLRDGQVSTIEAADLVPGEALLRLRALPSAAAAQPCCTRAARVSPALLRSCKRRHGWLAAQHEAAQRASRRSCLFGALALAIVGPSLCGLLWLPDRVVWPASAPPPPPTGDIVIIRLGDIVPADIKILAEEGGSGRPEDETPLQVGRLGCFRLDCIVVVNARPVLCCLGFPRCKERQQQAPCCRRDAAQGGKRMGANSH